MICQRCLENNKAQYRVYSDVINILVCASCAEQARELDLAVETLPSLPTHSNVREVYG